MRILSELYCKPCVIEPAMHKKICDIVDAHITGKMDNLAFMGIDLPEEKSVSMGIIDGNIAVIPIQGVISKHVGNIEKSSGMADVDDIEAMVKEALSNESVDGILFDVNSPGGGITGVPELAQIISEASDAIPTVAYTDELMASAAMWLAAGCGAIYSSQTAKVGSIGVYMAFLDQTRAMETAGLKVDLIKAGRLKGMGMPGTELTEEMRDMLQAEVNQVYKWFTSHVTAHRPVESESMQGQAFFGEDAVSRGLVDRIGTRGDAVRELKDMIRLLS
jgi:signal peptide peptidase SppA